ncbi:hypothetical protein JNB_07909 [Janibacter sp. HTCC2649]|uniref:type II toxin-antitoxin system VapC family toxin n=1 Tax=Janibacter sp. HTCC2649 TaxID=313589 RepID=UPI0000670C73|nr:type II toxin-antitoxin system VapC family toxin [Janibacter sp. HTCC2649]EAQ00079.1 hypothetical protein JNB_07909 [Janibacter sp. HTCC2649]
MILVDTSVWIDHLHATEPRLVALLESDEVGCHPLVIQELALGSIRRRDHVLGLLANLRPFPTLGHDEVLAFVEGRRLWGRGLSAADAHLVGAVTLVSGGQIWTRDKRLVAAANDVGVAVLPEG